MMIEFGKEDLELLSDAVLTKIVMLAESTKGLFVSKQLRESIDQEAGRLRLLNNHICNNLSQYPSLKRRKK